MYDVQSKCSWRLCISNLHPCCGQSALLQEQKQWPFRNAQSLSSSDLPPSHRPACWEQSKKQSHEKEREEKQLETVGHVCIHSEDDNTHTHLKIAPWLTPCRTSLSVASGSPGGPVQDWSREELSSQYAVSGVSNEARLCLSSV